MMGPLCKYTYMHSFDVYHHLLLAFIRTSMARLRHSLSTRLPFLRHIQPSPHSNYNNNCTDSITRQWLCLGWVVGWLWLVKCFILVFPSRPAAAAFTFLSKAAAASAEEGSSIELPCHILYIISRSRNQLFYINIKYTWIVPWRRRRRPCRQWRCNGEGEEEEVGGASRASTFLHNKYVMYSYMDKEREREWNGVVNIIITHPGWGLGCTLDEGSKGSSLCCIYYFWYTTWELRDRA